MNGNDELSLKDITFLRAIRDINSSPERYASTEQGVTPATVTAITEATTLTEEEVTCRLDTPRLGKGGLLKVYEAGPPAADSASLNSAELTDAGERAIAEAEDRERAVDAEADHPHPEDSKFDEMQEWEPANVESGGDTTASRAGAAGATAAHGSAEPAPSPRTEPQDRVTRKEAPGGASRAESPDDPPTDAEASTEDSTGAGVSPDGSTDGNDVSEDRLDALEARIDQLEAQREEGQSAADERVEELTDEVASLRETTDRLESTLDDALADLEEIRESEYGAIDEKRKQQFETAVKSMVAFHQLATEVLDVRVENYEPAAGRADPERVEITRNRIGDALGVGKRGSGGGMTIDAGGGDSDWPDPEEVARGGRAIGGDDGDFEATETMEAPESNAPDTGVYPPIGGGDAADESASEADGRVEDDSTVADSAASDSNASDSGVYPPIGEDRPDEGSAVDDEEGEDADTEGSAVPNSGVYPPIGGSKDTETGDRDDTNVGGTDADDEHADPRNVDEGDADVEGVHDADVEGVHDVDVEGVHDVDVEGVHDAEARIVDDSDSVDDADDRPGADTDTVSGVLPESVRPDFDETEGTITEAAADEGHAVDAIRSTDGAESERLPLDVDAAALDAVRRVIVQETSEPAADGWLLSDVDPVGSVEVRDAVAAERATDDPYPSGEAYARIVGEEPIPEEDRDTRSDEDPSTIPRTDGSGVTSADED